MKESKKMGLARNIARAAQVQHKGRERVYKFKESEFKRFLHHYSKEQKCICGRFARENLKPIANGTFAGDIVESSPDVEVI